MNIKVTCSICGSKHEVLNIKGADWHRWIHGEHVQNVWPQLSDDEREILIGYNDGLYLCPTCWDATISDEE